MFQTDCSLVSTEKPALQQRDYSMNSRQQFGRVGLASQDRDLMSVAVALERGVAQPTIRMHNAARLDRLLYEGHLTLGRSVGNAPHPNASDPPAILLRRHNNQCLRLGLAATHTLFWSSHVSLVDLAGSGQSIPARPHHGPSQFVHPTLSGLVASEPQHTLQTQGADTVLLAGHPPQGAEPNPQGSARVLKDRPRCQRSLVSTACALPECRAQPPCFRFSAARTTEPFRPSHPEKIVSAGFLRSEALSEVCLRPRVVLHGFHGPEHYLLWLPESSGYPHPIQEI